MMYFALAMWLFGTCSYEEVLAKLVTGLPELSEGVGDELASAAAITRARRRLGMEPLKALFDHVTALSCAEGAADLCPESRRVIAFDDFVMDVPDTPANRDAFGPPCGKGRYPRAWLASLLDCQTHRVLAAAIAPEKDQGVQALLGAWPQGLLDKETLLIGDDETIPPALWRAAAAADADQLWQVSDRLSLPATRLLPDGSYLSRLTVRDREPASRGHVDVRVICQDGADASGGTGRAGDPGHGPRLVTSFTGQGAAQADQIMAGYARIRANGPNVQQFAGVFGSQRVLLRSKSPELVQQEIYALLCTYHAIRHLMSPVALIGLCSGDIGHDRHAIPGSPDGFGGEVVNSLSQ